MSVMNSRRLIRSPRRRALISLPEKAQPWGCTWHELRLLLVPVQGGEGAHPRQRRAEPVLPAWDEITALAQRFPPVPCRTPAAPPPARWHAPSIFMGSFLFLGQAPPSLHRRRFSVQVVPFVRTYVSVRPKTF